MITLDIIGALYTPVVTDAAGDYVSGGDLLPGHHVNTVPAVPGWEPYRVEPASKRRVFAGMAAETVCYVFPDAETFLTAAIAAGLADQLAFVAAGQPA